MATTKKSETTSDPKAAAAKLAAMIPAPDDEPAAPKATQAIAKAEKTSPPAKAEDVQSPEPDPEIEVGSLTAGGPAPPLQTFELDEPRKTTASRRKRKTPARPNGSANSSAKKALQKMLPAAVRALVYKRNNVGKMDYVADYSANDLVAQGTIERFLHEYVIHEYGYGEYAVYFQEPGKDPQPAGSVSIAEPASHRRKKDQHDNSSTELLKLFLERDEKARAESANRKSPMEEMREMLGFFQTMTGGDKEKSSMDPMLMMMMMQMQNRPEPPKGPDPILLKIIDRMDQMADQQSAAHMLPPPPPPPPPQSDPMEGMAKMMAVLSEQNNKHAELLLQAIQGNRAPERNTIEDYVTLMRVNGASDDRLSTKDLLAMLPTLKGMIAPDPGKSSINEALETLRTVKILEREFGGNQDNQAASSFWDFLRDFVQSDAGSKVAEAITADQNTKRLEANHAQRREAIQGATQQQPQAEEEEGLRIPETFQPIAQEINTASTPQERLKGLVNAFQHLGKFPEFRPYMVKILGLMKQNRRIECLEFVASFLEGLIEAGSLEEEAAQQALNDLEQYWALVRTNLNMPDIEEVFPEGYEPEDQEDQTESGEQAIETDDDDEDEVDPPRQARRNPERDVRPPEPTPEQVAAREELERSRSEEPEPVVTPHHDPERLPANT